MRYWRLCLLITIAILITVFSGACSDDSLYSNPASPPAVTTEWRSISVDSSGGVFEFTDIGAKVTFPRNAVDPGVTYTFRIRLFPPGVPTVPTGPVFVRLGTFELTGPVAQFNVPVEVSFRIAERREPGLTTYGYRVNAENKWEFDQAAVVMSTGTYVSMRVGAPGIYGSFERVPLKVEAWVSMQQGPVPLSVALKAMVTGGNPPYEAVWDFGDNEEPKAGLAVSHLYKEPGVYLPTVTVTDADGSIVSDWLTLTAFSKPGPANF